MITADYKKASKLGITFQWNGVLSVNDLWSLGLESLRELAIDLSKKSSLAKDETSALLDLDIEVTNLFTKQVDTEVADLKFAIARDVLETRVQEIQDKKNKGKLKEELQELMELQEEDRKQSLKDMSTEERGKRIKELQAKL